MKRGGGYWGRKVQHSGNSWNAEIQAPLSVPFLQPRPGREIAGMGVGGLICFFTLSFLCCIILGVFQTGSVSPENWDQYGQSAFAFLLRKQEDGCKTCQSSLNDLCNFAFLNC